MVSTIGCDSECCCWSLESWLARVEKKSWEESELNHFRSSADVSLSSRSLLLFFPIRTISVSCFASVKARLQWMLSLSDLQSKKSNKEFKNFKTYLEGHQGLNILLFTNLYRKLTLV